MPPGNKEVNNAHTWWAYNPKQDLVLGNILGGWLLFNKRRQEHLGQKSSFAVSNGSPRTDAVFVGDSLRHA